MKNAPAGAFFFRRSRADSNRSSSFCRAVPSHSATRPFMAGEDRWFQLHYGGPGRTYDPPRPKSTRCLTIKPRGLLNVGWEVNEEDPEVN